MVLAPQHECSARQRLQLLLAAGTLQISLVLCEQTFCDPEINRSYAMMAMHYGIGIVPARPYPSLSTLNLDRATDQLEV